VVVALLTALAALVAFAIWWRFFRVARPEHPPLSLPPDDALMLDAMRKATETLDRFRELLGRPHKSAHAKVRFVSNAGETEFLWSEVRALRESELEVLYTTPPVTHTGRLERIQTHPLADLVDWQVETPEGLYEGGFTMLAMFTRAREQWGSLPPELAAQERRYRTGHTGPR
jgi:uncharacterized protein YegJ (DUF2314 family)